VTVLFLDSVDALRTWAGSRGDADEVWLGFHRVRYGVEPAPFRVADAAAELAALEWVETGRAYVDDDRYAVRFAPGRVRRRAAPTFADEGAWPRGSMPVLDAAYEEEFRAHGEAWTYFEQQAPKYRRVAIWWVTGGKSEETRRRRLDALIASSEAGERVAQLLRQM
jgi:hypothetical protein